jgi:cytochrome c biogenesis protein CcdA/thiol-disulfide isomerase/thioredoxin
VLDPVSISLGFLEGLSLIASPCILPVLPIVLSTTLTGQKNRPYGIITGFVVTFCALTLGTRFLVETFQLDPTALRITAFVMLVFVGLFLLSERLSDWFAQRTASISEWGNRLQHQVDSQPSGGGFLSGLLIGACIGAVWVPCSGPVLAAVLVQSIQQKSSLSSILTLAAFSLGAGLPMLAIALGGQTVMKRLEFVKRHGTGVRKAFGAVILLTVMLTSQDIWNLPELGLKPNAFAAVKGGPTLENPLETPYPAPKLVGIHQWLNSKPLELSKLKGKVVLVDFWTYSCINCLRTLPHLRDWDAKYRDAGLVIIGVHSPEFAFEQNPANVERAIQKYGIKYPVAMDNEMKTFTAFDNLYWPAHYLIDKSGKVVYTHFGEGEYEVTEKNIQTLLGKSLQGKNIALGESAKPPINFFQTPETYLGLKRINHYQGVEEPIPNKTIIYHAQPQLELHHWGLSGAWKATQEYIQAGDSNAALLLHFNAKKVFLVLGTESGQPVPVQVYLDNKPMGKPLTVTNHRLYTLLSLPDQQEGLLKVQPLAPGLQAYAFTFES